MKVFVYYIGRQKDAHLNALAEDYLARIARYTTAQMAEVRVERTNLWAKHPTARKIFLDPGGQRFDSPAFASVIAKAELEARDLLFLIGGHDGLPGAWLPQAHLLLSLSPLTMPHELARVVLTEQIYRAFASLRGHPYPR